MECFCDKPKIFVKLEADVGADPIWCNQCECNLDIDELPISEELRESVMNWAMQYGKWIDWDNDELCENGLVLEAEHNQLGQTLSENLQIELGETTTVRFSPSNLANMYK